MARGRLTSPLKLVRPGSRAASRLASAAASRPSQVASRCFSLIAATGAPLRLRHARPAAQLSVRSVSPTQRRCAILTT
jgi:hypothetical protein